jgi:hypothetical protein
MAQGQAMRAQAVLEVFKESPTFDDSELFEAES